MPKSSDELDELASKWDNGFQSSDSHKNLTCLPHVHMHDNAMCSRHIDIIIIFIILPREIDRI